MLSDFWNGYKRNTQFGIVFMVALGCLVIFLAELGLMFGFQNNEIQWQGACRTGELEVTSAKVVLPVTCEGSGQDGFVYKSPELIAYVGNNKTDVIYCELTQGSVMLDEAWKCSITGEE